jgi:hypothetical protein
MMQQTENACPVSQLPLYDHNGKNYVARVDIANNPHLLSYDEANKIISRLIPTRANSGKYYYAYTEFLEELAIIERERREAIPQGKHIERRFRGYSLVRRDKGKLVPYSPAWGEYNSVK